MREILLGCASCLLQSCVTDHGRTRKVVPRMQEQALRNVRPKAFLAVAICRSDCNPSGRRCGRSC